MTERSSSPIAIASTLTSTLACVALVLAPGAWEGALSGTRFHVLQAAALVAVFTAVLSRLIVSGARPIGWRTTALLVALVVLKAGLGLVDVPAGWRGTYTMLTPDPPAVGQFVWRLGVHSYRIDRYPGTRGSAPALPFLNDFHRYNAPRYAPPRSHSEGLRTSWSGWFETAAPATLELYVQSAGAASIWIDNRIVASADITRPLSGLTRAVDPGWHRVTVLYDKAPGAAPGIFAQLLVGGRPLVVRPWPAAPPLSSQALAAVSDAVAAAGVLWWLWQMAWALRRGRVRGGAGAGGAIVAAAAALTLATFAVVHAAPFDARTYELRPGDDHLAYEGLARNILLEGVLMPEGKAPGEGRPFYFYPLYSYTLAAWHLALGDSYAVVVLLNAVAAATLPVFFWLLGWRHLAVGPQVLGQAALIAFILRHNARYFESPLTDSLFIPLVFATLVLATRTVRSGRPADAFLTGAGVAACATTRPSFFLFTGPFILVLLWSGRTRALLARLGPPVALVAGYAVALSPVVLRNWIMAGQAVAMVTLSHAIPISLVPPEAQNVAFLDNPDLYSWESSLRLAWSLIVADPAGVAWLETRKVLFTLGLTHLGPGQPPLLVEFPLLCVAGVAALAWRRVPAATALVLCAFVMSHLAAIVIAYPWTYGYKTILPVQLVFLFSALHLLEKRRSPAPHAR